MLHKMEKKEYFDASLLREFRDNINSSNVFVHVPEYKHLWNLICVLMDRLDSTIHYLNNHIDQPKTEEDFVFFLVYASILKDGVYKFYENIYGIKPKTIENKRWFKDTCDYSKTLFDENSCPTDDVFFEYLRALAFAHPFGVDNRSRPFMKSNEIHYSPWVISKSEFGFGKDYVGLRIYSNKYNDLKDVFISFGNLKKYLLERYSLFKTFIKWGSEEIMKQNQKWLETKIDRSQNPLETLESACLILESRFAGRETIDTAIKILKSSFIFEQNKAAVNHVKERIISQISRLCDCIDNMDYEGMEECLNFLYERPINIHEHANYELEKIFNYLGDEKGLRLHGSNEEWGLIQAAQFYESYAKKFVVIDFEAMTNLEIKILIKTSLILGKEKEDNNKAK